MGTHTVLGFDFGTRRIGVAVGQDVTGTAEALETVRVVDARPDWDAIARLIEAWAPTHLVVGCPSHADGTPPPVAAAAQRFARRLEGRFRLPVSLVDERLSSRAAADAGDALRRGLDAAAARVILETWFAGQREAAS